MEECSGKDRGIQRPGSTEDKIPGFYQRGTAFSLAIIHRDGFLGACRISWVTNLNPSAEASAPVSPLPDGGLSLLFGIANKVVEAFDASKSIPPEVWCEVGCPVTMMVPSSFPTNWVS